MKTVRNKTWIIYLVLGAYSLLICLLVGSCSKDGRGRNAQFYYVNETDHFVTVSFRTETIFTLKPRESHIIRESQPSNRRAKNVVAEEYVNPLSINDLTIKLDDKCLTSTANSVNSILNISNYQSEKIANADFKFTYKFTEADYNRAGICR